MSQEYNGHWESFTAEEEFKINSFCDEMEREHAASSRNNYSGTPSEGERILPSTSRQHGSESEVRGESF